MKVVGIITIVIVVVVALIAIIFKQCAKGDSLKDLQNSRAIMWAGPHPDDEIYPSGLIALASLGYKKPVYVVAGYAKGTTTAPGTAEDRVKDNQDYKNLTNLAEYVYAESYLKQETGDLKTRAFEFLSKFVSDHNIDLIITFENTHGSTGNPEHIAVSKWLTEFAKQEGIKLYYFINRVPGTNLREGDGGLDPLPYTDELNLDDHSVSRNGQTLSLWQIKYEVVKIYSSSQPGSYYITQHPELLNNIKHLEHYRKVN